MLSKPSLLLYRDCQITLLSTMGGLTVQLVVISLLIGASRQQLGYDKVNIYPTSY